MTLHKGMVRMTLHRDCEAWYGCDCMGAVGGGRRCLPGLNPLMPLPGNPSSPPPRPLHLIPCTSSPAPHPLHPAKRDFATNGSPVPGSDADRRVSPRCHGDEKRAKRQSGKAAKRAKPAERQSGQSGFSPPRREICKSNVFDVLFRLIRSNFAIRQRMRGMAAEDARGGGRGCVGWRKSLIDAYF